jgi:hypothetical protein
LQAPTSGAGVAQPVTLDWADVQHAVSYEVRVDDSSTMSSPFVANRTVATSEAVLSGLPVRQLWWRVRAQNSAGVFGPFSTTRTFTPQAGSAAPSLSAFAVSPTSVIGGSSATGTVSLSAPAPIGGTAVMLTSADASASVPSSVTVAGGQSTATFAVSTTSVTSARPATLTATAGSTSRTATMTVDPPTTPTLPAPSLQSPANDARYDEGDTIGFNWTDVGGAAGYSIAIDDQETFASPITVRIVSASAYSTSTLPDTRMWWRARAFDSSGAAGAWSTSRRLEVR